MTQVVVERTMPHQRFMEWRDLVVTPAVEAVVVAGAACATWAASRATTLGIADTLLTFYAAQFAIAALFVRVLRAVWPAREGVHQTGSTQRYVFHLVGFLCNVNLHAVFVTSAVPPFVRRYVYSLFGARVRGGIVMIGGRIADPWLVSLGRSAMVGDGALVLGHALAIQSATEDALVLGRVEIGDGALIGANALVMPGVRIGAHSMVQPMSLVATGTRIPPYEVWGGSPARKVGDVRRSAPCAREDDAARRETRYVDGE